MRVIHVLAHHRAQKSVGPCILTNPECAWDTGWGELVDRCYHHQYWHLSWKPFGSQGAGLGCPALPWRLKEVEALEGGRTIALPCQGVSARRNVPLPGVFGGDNPALLVSEGGEMTPS